MNPIKIFVTGGTFDKEYNELNGELYFKKTHLHEMLELGRSKLKVDIETLMMKDSLDMSDADRDSIVQKCFESNENKILITHGTDTMVKTAKLLSAKITTKTIVLTGAMIPYKFGSSDGLFNLGSALSFLQSLPYGIYIAMNGNIYSWNNVKKNKELGLFQSLED
jgi:L-asparaginase